MLDILIKDGQISALGMLVIVAIIFVIFIAIKLLGASKSRSAKSDKKNETVVEKNITVPTPSAPSIPEAQNDTELVAILAAAISAYCGEPVTKFRVVSFKRIK